MLPAAPQIVEGSIWDLTDPEATIVLAQRSITAHIDIYKWTRQHQADQWRGITVGHRVALVSPPFWLWRATDILSGEYVVVATTFNYILDNQYNDQDHATLGLVLLARLLTRGHAPRTVL